MRKRSSNSDRLGFLGVFNLFCLVILASTDSTSEPSRVGEEIDSGGRCTDCQIFLRRRVLAFPKTLIKFDFLSSSKSPSGQMAPIPVTSRPQVPRRPLHLACACPLSPGPITLHPSHAPALCHTEGRVLPSVTLPAR